MREQPSMCFGPMSLGKKGIAHTGAVREPNAAQVSDMQKPLVKDFK